MRLIYVFSAQKLKIFTQNLIEQKLCSCNMTYNQTVTLLYLNRHTVSLNIVFAKVKTLDNTYV